MRDQSPHRTILIVRGHRVENGLVLLQRQVFDPGYPQQARVVLEHPLQQRLADRDVDWIARDGGNREVERNIGCDETCRIPASFTLCFQ